MEIQLARSPNYSTGRKGKSIIAIVEHITAGLMPGTLSWLQSAEAQASAHFLVTQIGEIFQLVDEENTAWHAGIVNDSDWELYDGTNPNRYTIGIEHECLEGGALTDAQYAATLWLHKYLIQKWGIPADTAHIIGHCRIDTINRPNDPGPDFPWNRLFADLTGASSVIYTPLKIQVNQTIVHGVAAECVSYAPVRSIAEALGQPVQWDPAGNTVYIGIVPIYHGYTNQIKIAIGSITIDAIVIDNVSYAPVRTFVEALGRTVAWDAENKVVIVV